MREMRLAKIYRCSLIHPFQIYARGLKFKKSPPALTTPPLGYFVIPEMELARLYPCTKFEVSIFTRSKDTARVAMQWLDARECVPKLAR